MIEDPIIAELRRHREEHAAEYGHDLERIVASLQRREAESKRTVLNPGPKYLDRANQQLTSGSAVNVGSSQV